MIKSLNPIFVLILIPLCNKVVYPLLAKCGILKTALQKMTLGMFLAVVAFLISGFLQVTSVKNFWILLLIRVFY